MHTTRNSFKRENFNMKNTETAFHSFQKFEYLSLHIVFFLTISSSRLRPEAYVATSKVELSTTIVSKF